MPTISGKWTWDSSPSGGSSTGFIRTTTTFVSNGTTYYSMMVTPAGSGSDIAIAYSDSTVYETSGGWTSSGYRTVDFGSSGVSMDSDFYNYFTANATKEAEKYTITYYMCTQIEGSTQYSAAEKVATQTYTAGASITAPSMGTIAGYGSVEWENLPSTMPAQNLTIYGYRNLNLYTLTFKMDGTTIKTEKVAHTLPINYPADPTKDGYRFTGWDSSLTVMPMRDLTINATFEKIEIPKYTITYYVCMELSSGGYAKEELVGTQTYEAGDSISPPTVAPVSGYKDVRWENLPSTMPANDLTIYGYRDAIRYTITFKVEGSTVETDELMAGDRITYPSDPYKQDYNFTGWSPNLTYMPSYDITINATFEEIPTYTIKYYTRREYNNNGVIAVTDPEPVATQTYREGDVISPPNYPKEQGYTPTGWVY